MFTETELRDMLRDSADRVPADRIPAGCERTDGAIPLRPRRPGRRVAATLAVAAATAALATAVTALADRSDGAHRRPTAGRPVIHTAPPVTPASPRHRSTAHQATTAIIDAVTVRTTRPTENYVAPAGEDDHGQQVIATDLAGDHLINLVIAPATAFDGSHVSHSHPVRIGGTTGYYDVLRLFPLSDDGDGGSAPTGTIVFRTPDRRWAFVWLQDGTHDNADAGTPVDDPSAIRHAFAELHATFVTGHYRTPIKLGYLPAGARFISADQTTAATPGVTYASVTATDGNRQMDISLLHRTEPATDSRWCRVKVLGCVFTRERDLGGGWQLEVQGTHYSVAETQRVLDHVQVAPDLSDRSTYFTLPDAIG